MNAIIIQSDQNFKTQDLRLVLEHSLVLTFLNSSTKKICESLNMFLEHRHVYSHPVKILLTVFVTSLNV